MGLRPDYWRTGWRFETWQNLSDPDRKLTPHLEGWASAFNLCERWVLEGALQTMLSWSRHRKLSRSRDPLGFHVPSGGYILSATPDVPGLFTFNHPGWDPQLEKWSRYQRGLLNHFNEVLSQYKKKLRSLVESRGAVRSRSMFAEDSFGWLARYQCCGDKLEDILRTASNVSDKTTIWKGIEKAAGLVKITLRPKSVKLKSR